MESTERQQDYVLRTVEERGVRMIRLWFTDVLGQLKSFAISPAELENAFEEGMQFDGSAIDGFSRVQESDVLARPDPNSFELLPWADDDEHLGPHVLRHRQPRRHARSRATPARCCGATSTGPASRGFTFYAAPEMEFFYFADGDSGRAAQAARPGVVLRPHHRRRRHRPAPAHDPHARGDGHPGRVQPPRGRPQPARDRPALHRRADDGRQRHDVPAGREGGGARARACTPRSCPSRSPACRARACTPTSRCSRATPTPSTTRATTANLSKVARGLHRRPAAPRRGDHRRHQPVGQLLQAPGRRLRGADLRVVGPQQPLGARQRAADQAGQGRERPHRVPGARPAPATPTSPSR